VQDAYAAIGSSQVQLINILNIEIAELGQVVASHFGRHRDAEHYLSLPGIGTVLGARILGEFGDDPDRYADGKARRNYAGTSPITRASGTRRVVLARYARNRRLADAVHQWAFCAMRGSPGARTYYQSLRERGTGHQAALRQLGNRLVGILHGCLKINGLRRGNRLGSSSARDLTFKNMGCLPQIMRVAAATGTLRRCVDPRLQDSRIPLPENHTEPLNRR
jgi:transposase